VAGIQPGCRNVIPAKAGIQVHYPDTLRSYKFTWYLLNIFNEIILSMRNKQGFDLPARLACPAPFRVRTGKAKPMAGRSNPYSLGLMNQAPTESSPYKTPIY